MNFITTGFFPLMTVVPLPARSFQVNPVINSWWIAVLAGVAVSCVVFLYTPQRQIAGRRIVTTLTAIRLLLILLVIVLLLAPIRQWSYAHHSRGALWLLVDQSLSMRQKDKQATDAERLVWADSLGYLPPDLRLNPVCRCDAEAKALRDEWNYSKSDTGRPSQLKDWRDKLSKLISELPSEPQISQAGNLLQELVQPFRKAKTDVPAGKIRDRMNQAIEVLHAAAGKAEADYLDLHGSDARVKAALAKVGDMSRADLAYAALTGGFNRSASSLAQAMSHQDVKIVSFGSRPRLIATNAESIRPTLQIVSGNPDEQSTDIASALRLVAEHLDAHSVVLLVSDGQQNAGGDSQRTAEELASRGARVFGLSIGSHRPVRDASVDSIDAPDWVFAGDQIIVSPALRLDGLKDLDVTVELRRDNQLVEQKTIRVLSDQETRRVQLTDQPPKEGVFTYQVAIQPLPKEETLENNQASVRVTVRQEKLNVLLVEDEPRWEYQFLRNYLARDHRVRLQAVLLTPARIENVQPPVPIKASPLHEAEQIDAQILPTTPAEWSAFNIVILGDVPPERLPPLQQQNLLDLLKEGRIQSLLMIAGPRNMPARYAGSLLADAMPVELSRSRWTNEELQEQLRLGYKAAVTAEGMNSILGQFSQDAALNAELWGSMPAWYWHSEFTSARPGATVDWTINNPQHAPVGNALQDYQSLRQRALLSTINVGLGRVMYLAAPQTWRLRYVEMPGSDPQVEDLHRRFWGQAMRWAAEGDLPAGTRFARFGSDKSVYRNGEPIILTARLTNNDFTPLTRQVFKIVARQNGMSTVGEAAMTEASDEGAGNYRGMLSLPPGSYSLSIEGAHLEPLIAAAKGSHRDESSLHIEVESGGSIEYRNLNADPQRMAAIAEAGSGIAVDGPYFDLLGEHLPKLDHTERTITQAGLFSNPDDRRTQLSHWIFFAVFVALISAEWILRKRNGLI